MRIDSSTIGMESARSYKTSNVTVRRFMIKDYQAALTQGEMTQDAENLNTAVNGNEKNNQEATDTNSESGKVSLSEWQSRFDITASRISLRTTESNALENIRQLTIRYIFDLLFADRRNRFNLAKEQGEEGLAQQETTGQQVLNQQGAVNQPKTSYMGNQFVVQMRVLSYTRENWQIETEQTNFSTTGTVRTGDGREISFNVNVGMSREFSQYYAEELDMGTFQMCDPLVINLDTDVAELSDQNFYFDIDADGEQDEIAQLSGKSGYLALDQNGDGTINDGSELFGTQSGNGFADLAKYDEDGNGWIDEGDAVWSKLKIWCKNEKGEDILYRLADKGVGAICLQNAATDFTLQGDTGNTRGAIRSTGVFLYENGNVGTVQHVDVAKYQQQA